jgi:hypothetical protein
MQPQNLKSLQNDKHIEHIMFSAFRNPLWYDHCFILHPESNLLYGIYSIKLNIHYFGAENSIVRTPLCLKRKTCILKKTSE